MDFITQTLLGSIAAQATLTPRLGRKAALFGAMGGALPDFDVFLLPLADPALPFELHRHFTHSLFFIPAAGALAALPFLLVRKWRGQGRWVFAATTIGAATHGLLDNLTSYGTHLLWPVVAERTSWDAMSIIDPIFTGLLFLGVVLSLVMGRLRPAAVALGLGLAYIALGFVQHERASRAQERIAASRGHVIEQGRVTPTLGNLILWRSVYVADGVMHADAVRVRLLAEPLVCQGRSMPRLTTDEVIRSGVVSPDDEPRVRQVLGGLTGFATGYVGELDLRRADVMFVGDMRFSIDTAGFEPIWGLTIGPAGADPPVRWGEARMERADAMAGFWDELISPGLEYKPISTFD